jgi:2-hydroxy-3-oxopropionate reductase
MVAGILGLVSEAIVLLEASGVDPQAALPVLSGGLAGSAVMEAKKEKFFSHDFEPGFRIELHHKDLGIALAAGREYGVALPVTAIVDQMLEASKAKGRGDRDHSAILTHIEDSSGHEIGS